MPNFDMIVKGHNNKVSNEHIKDVHEKKKGGNRKPSLEQGVDEK